jgi:hypothetical protein
VAKGQDFEREFCKSLSRWWTRGTCNERDDVFWRTQNSGGRATTRHKQGKTTRGQYGDIMATDPIGQPLLDLLTFELKRGYSTSTIGDLLDTLEQSTSQQYEKWLAKAEDTAERSGSVSYALVVRRDRRSPLILMPLDCMSALLYSRPTADIAGMGVGAVLYLEDRDIAVTRLQNFLDIITPDNVRSLHHRLRGAHADTA